MTMGIIATNPGGYEMLELSTTVAAVGGRMIGQSHCRGINVLLSFETRLPFDLLPEWHDVRALPDRRAAARAARPVRARAADPRRRWRATTRRWRGIGAKPRKPDFDGIRVYERGLPPNPTSTRSRRSGASPGGGDDRPAPSRPTSRQLFIQPSLYPQDPEVLLRCMRHPRTVMTFSDSGAHLSQIADASIHTHLLGHWVRDRQEFTLEEAVRMLTLAPAMAWGFADRGLVREGMVADLNVFDPERGRPRGARGRPRPPARRQATRTAGRGFRATVVGGEITILDGESTGVRPGRLVRSR